MVFLMCVMGRSFLCRNVVRLLNVCVVMFVVLVRLDDMDVGSLVLFVCVLDVSLVKKLFVEVCCLVCVVYFFIWWWVGVMLCVMLVCSDVRYCCMVLGVCVSCVVIVV